jgi:F-type H+-transporting ATPase subunit b
MLGTHVGWMAVLQEHATAPASPFEVNFGLFFWTWIVFLALFVVLRRFAWPVILKNTLERERRIKHELAEAAKMQAEAKALLEEHQRLMVSAKGQSHALLAEAKALAEREREALLAKARQEQEQILERAKREIGVERDRAMAQLRREAVDLSLAAAARLVEARMDSEADRRLVTEFLESVEKAQ